MAHNNRESDDVFDSETSNPIDGLGYRAAQP